MEQLISILDWIINNYGTIISVLSTACLIASMICAATKTPKSSMIYKIIEIIAINVGRAKDAGDKGSIEDIRHFRDAIKQINKK